MAAADFRRGGKSETLWVAVHGELVAWGLGAWGLVS
jgi:hypothetical protein